MLRSEEISLLKEMNENELKELVNSIRQEIDTIKATNYQLEQDYLTNFVEIYIGLKLISEKEIFLDDLDKLGIL